MKRPLIRLAGYRHVRCLGNREHLLRRDSDGYEVWRCARIEDYGIPYKNTYLKFVREATIEDMRKQGR